MGRTTKAIKRGSIRLKSHSEINLILSDLDGMRSDGKSCVKSQQFFVEDLLKWAQREHHEGVNNLFSSLKELNTLWSNIHDEYFESLKKFKNQFELILESERSVDKAKANLRECERNEAKAKNRLSHSFSDVEEYQNHEGKLKVARRALDVAKLEMAEKMSENEITKLIMVKEGLKKLTDSYISLSQNCNVILQAQKSIVDELPDEIGVNHEPRHINDCKAKEAVTRAKTLIQTSSSSNVVEACPSEYEAPPPYSPYFSTFTTTSNQNMKNMTSTGSNSTGWPQNYRCSNEPKTYVCCKCSSQMISDHKYVQVHENTSSLETQVTSDLRNARIS